MCEPATFQDLYVYFLIESSLQPHVVGLVISIFTNKKTGAPVNGEGSLNSGMRVVVRNSSWEIWKQVVFLYSFI